MQVNLRWYFYMLVLCFSLFYYNDQFGQTFDWTKQTFGVGQKVTHDSQGNVYVLGNYYNSSSNNTFLTKFDLNGNVIWTNQIVDAGNVLGQDITVDASGNVYITGYFSYTATFNTISLTTGGGSNCFIAKYSSDGECLWAKQSGGSGGADGEAIKMASDGNVVIAGFGYNTQFGSFTQSSSGNDVLVVKYDPNGNIIWANQAGMGPYTYGTAIDIDNSGNIYITGHNNGLLYVVKFDKDGNKKWDKQSSGSGADVHAQGIAVDSNGNILIAGYFSGHPIFGSYTLSSMGNDVFITKLNSVGDVIWVKTFDGNSNDDYGWDLSIDSEGSSYVTGTLNFSTWPNSDNKKLFISKFDKDGNNTWNKYSTGSSWDEGRGIDITSVGSGFVCGNMLNSGKISKFSIPNISITSPVGNESWQTNTQHNITWNSNDDGNIKIEITTDNGGSWITLANSVAANLGNYNFTVPPFSSTNNCKIRLTSLSYNNNSTSPSNFAITSSSVPNLMITAPNTALTWNSGSTQNITWSLSGSIINVKLEYTTDNGTSWSTIVGSTSAAAQSYSWTVPSSPSSSCRIRISDVDNAPTNDVSDQLFSIGQITVTSPNGGETWKAGTTKNITWQSTAVANVNLYYSSDDGSNWNSITTNLTASNGTYSWTVPSTSSATCRIKIADASNSSFLDESNNTFRIWQPITSTFTPSTGQISQSFGSTNITLSGFIVVQDAITVTYLAYESPQSGTLPVGVASTSQYYWTISSPSISIINGYVSVPVASLSGVTDPTKLVWLKRSNSGDAWTNIGGTITDGNLVSTSAFNSLSEFAIGITNGTLPIEIRSFNASSNNKGIYLQWKTSTEVNNYGFEIERKNKDWEKIGFVQGHGNSNSSKEYSFIDDKPLTGKIQYRLKQLDNDGKFKYYEPITVNVDEPKEFKLMQNSPNPFNPTTAIKFQLPLNSFVTVKIYDMIGREITTLINEEKPAGSHIIFWNGKDSNGQTVSSGIYLYKLTAGTYSETRKMNFLK
ncbi:MAG: SBBP repeat-containing protein [Bacteroidota bacterium]|nr:SBBP repeat-containing protein [Bacteroidota bacterium]